MRISDWSSDVCSSDLRLVDVLYDRIRIEGCNFGRVLLGYRLAPELHRRCQLVAACLPERGEYVKPLDLLGPRQTRVSLGDSSCNDVDDPSVLGEYRGLGRKSQ